VEKEIARISSFIKGQVSKSHTSGVVVGISGGIDSAVVASLCSIALGSRKVLGVFLFEERSRKSQDLLDARAVARIWESRLWTCPLLRLSTRFAAA